MNQILVNIYLKTKKPKFGKDYCRYFKKDIEEIILGDVALRDKQREEYIESEFEKNLNKVIKNYK